ncbi:hypothetical protein WAI453_009032 [Rhynchosporium graminicola]|uniref:Related to M.genitalium alanine--tRNA ligase n=1 Tax=Rhynchosporium graminicola TaxID=2792576 RepID=A0A1E1L2F2_9HELO|nr:related to M.genitalium alanine--tRNA ligase [Rhynchosporium commune]
MDNGPLGRRRRFGHFTPIRSPQVQQPRYMQRHPIPELPPLQNASITPNPQLSSPLYDGRIPPEIRNSIFQFALTEDTTILYDANKGYTRPYYTGRKKVDTALLQTCRAIYLETFHLPAANKEHVFWHPPETGPHGRFYSDRNGWEREKEMFYGSSKMMSWQVELVKEIHLFTQEFWLEQYFNSYCDERFMNGIEKVKITIRRCDWWWNERNNPLGINPYRGNADSDQMTRDIVACKNGEVPEWNMAGWAGAFSKLPNLKELEMELETSDDKIDELVAIVEWAKMWKFPFRDGKVLNTEGVNAKPVQTWQGPMCFWSQICPYCAGYGDCLKTDTPNEKCTERMRLRGLSMGPLCSVYSLRWKVAEGDSTA